jgi:tungstate transport system substrate-binding protein
MMRKLAALFAVLLVASPVAADTMKMAVTTSFHNSGLSDEILPVIQEDLGLEVQLIVVGTGQALQLGEAGDVDAVLVHSRAAEEAFVAAGFGTHRREIMYNDFILVGPEEDPAAIRVAASATNALRMIANTKSVFVSRGDDSGTHKMELGLWNAAGIGEEARDSSWYRAAGAGMGATLNTAAGMGGYVLADRASWLNFGNKTGMALLFAGDPVLFNQYAYLPVNPERHPHVNTAAVQALEGWLTSEKGQALIGAYEIAGEKLFFPNATPMQ